MSFRPVFVFLKFYMYCFLNIGYDIKYICRVIKKRGNTMENISHTNSRMKKFQGEWHGFSDVGTKVRIDIISLMQQYARTFVLAHVISSGEGIAQKKEHRLKSILWENRIRIARIRVDTITSQYWKFKNLYFKTVTKKKVYAII